jgi:hypothetical protein
LPVSISQSKSAATVARPHPLDDLVGTDALLALGEKVRDSDARDRGQSDPADGARICSQRNALLPDWCIHGRDDARIRRRA